MARICDAWNIELRLAFDFPRVIAASKDIDTPHMLFHRTSIIAQGNSMGELDIALKDEVAKVFRDISPQFPKINEKCADDPDASHLFYAVIMGVTLTLGKVKGGLATLVVLLRTIHQSTVLLRALPTQRQLPQSDRLNLFKEIVALVSDTIPITKHPFGWGKALNSSEFIRKNTIEEKLSSIRNRVRILIECSQNMDTRPQELYPVTRPVI
ncbi:hypothetical protein DL96DRAFT_1820035 [Flagelloscypha sp. PMI_526]|nr:hypothetical protein DL96DRAFT_1820035 [Flagelloscypha sp. PMI_526]